MSTVVKKSTTGAAKVSVKWLDAYNRDGYFIFPQLLPAELVKELSAAAEALTQQVGPLVNENPRVRVDQTKQGVRIRKVEPLIDISEPFARLSRNPLVTGLLETLFGEAPVLFEDKLNYKYPEGGSEFQMHQDWFYWQDFSPRLTTALIYLDDATAENGCLEVIPGWHTRGLLHSNSAATYKERQKMAAEVWQDQVPTLAPGKAGTVLLFSCMTPHMSKANLSNKARRAIILTYNPVSDGAHYEDAAGKGRDAARAWVTAATK
ncbi:MAG TPA: phytanoyl-CoA dioxygenase family protein [Planctomycetota bacterium]|nr:phytanoyl-CoA dioxygenase family protein [Planctomycetota bacterium]